MSSMWRLLIVLGSLGGAVAAAAPSVDSSSYGAHTVVSPARKTAYVMTQTKGTPTLVAIDLTTGKPRWTSTTAAKPIIARGNSLVALGAGGQAMVLDARTGRKAKPCSAIAVSAPFVDGLGTNQAATGHDDGTTLYLMWTRHTHYAGGAAPSPETEARARTKTEITWAIDLATCAATVVTTAPHVQRSVIDATSDVLTDKAKVARIVRDPKAGTITLTPAAKPTPIDLTEGDPRRTAVSISVDRRFAMCGDPATTTNAIFDLETGAVTRPKVGFQYNWLSLGNYIIVAAGGVVAIDATTGRTAWTVAERATQYRGPYPPSAAR